MDKDVVHNNDEESACSNEIKFSPPVYIQRYQLIHELIQEYKPTTVIDFGCAECKLISRLKQENVKEIIGVDIDQHVLESNARHLEPLLSDYLIARNPLTIKLYQGSVSQFDERLKNFDMIILLELIEHLYEETLLNVPQNIFGNMKPKHVIISTPNADFNVLFKSMPFGNFRHPDHKFEWTRREFETWCKVITSKYPYDVKFTGVGSSEKDAGVGYCSQFAIFTKHVTNNVENLVKNSSDSSIPYGLVKEIIYPFKSLTQKRNDDIFFALNKIINEIISLLLQKKNHNEVHEMGLLWRYTEFTHNTVQPLHSALISKIRTTPSKYIAQEYSTVVDQFEDTLCQDSTAIQLENIFDKYTETLVIPAENYYWIKNLEEKYFNNDYLTKPIYGQFDDAVDENQQNIEIFNECIKKYGNSGLKDFHLPYTYSKINHSVTISINFLLERQDILELQPNKDELIHAIHRLDYRKISCCGNVVLIDLDLYYGGKSGSRHSGYSSGYESDEYDKCYYSDEDGQETKEYETLCIKDFIEESWD